MAIFDSPSETILAFQIILAQKFLDNCSSVRSTKCHAARLAALSKLLAHSLIEDFLLSNRPNMILIALNSKVQCLQNDRLR